jgi:RNA polymerase sigma factor, sigma-70 family
MELDTFKTAIIPLREKLLAYTTKLADNQVDAEDIVQDVFLKLWSIRDKLDDYDNVEALALKITKNKTLDELKCSRYKNQEILEKSAYNAFRTASDPAMITECKDMVDHVKRLIGALPSLQQTIVRMKDVEGYELSEIAAITGTQIEAVRNNLSRARKRIREKLMKR